MSAEVFPSLRVHPAEDLLEEYAFGRVREPLLAPFEEHLFICSACQTKLQEVETYIALMKSGAAALEARERKAVEERKAAPIPVAIGVPAWFAHSQLQVARVVGVTALLVAMLAGGWWVWQEQLARRVAESPAVVLLAALRSAYESGSPSAPANHTLVLQIDATRLTGMQKPMSLEVVNTSGMRIWQGAAIEQTETEKSKESTLSATLTSGLKPGQYWARLYSGDGTLVREFSLRVK
jgi:hypothetical protein